MADTQENHNCPLCRTLGETTFTLSSENGILKVRLETEDIQKSLKEQMAKCYGNRRAQHRGRQNKKINVREYYVLGQNIGTTSILELVDLLLERDYPSIVAFDQEGTVGPVFIPEGYLPKKPKVIDPGISSEIKEQFPDDKIIYGEIKQTEGDLLERQVYDALQQHFKSRKKEDVLIVKGIELVKIGGARGRNVHELDFLVVDFKHQYILNIEVKKWLGQIEGKPENIIDKARDQLDTNKALLEDWFGADLKGNWRYVSTLFCKDMEQILKDCLHCNPFIATNQEEVLNIMKNLELSQPEDQVKFFEDFKIICKYILFSAPKIALPVTGNMITAVHEAIQKAGSTENIKVWCYHTPEQRMVFSSPKLIFLSPWGTGKTLFMITEAIQIAERGEKVLFLLFNRSKGLTTSKKSLLAMDLELKFQAYEDFIKVETVLFKDGKDNKLQEIGANFDHVMCDELFADIDRLTQKSQRELKDFFSSKKTVWMALSSDYHYSAIDGSIDPEALVKEWFPDFQVAQMKTPLRMPKTVAEDIKDSFVHQTTTDKKLTLNSWLMAKSTLPINLTEGCQIENYGFGKLEPIHELLEEAFDKLPKGRSVVIVIQQGSLQSFHSATRSAVKCKHCWDLVDLLAIDIALAKLGKKVLYYCINFSSSEQSVKEFLSGQREGEILVVSFELMRGIEYPIIIDTLANHDISSRSSSKLVRIHPNNFFDIMNLYEQLLKEEQHICKEITARESRPDYELSIASFVGEISIILELIAQNNV